MKFFCVTIIWFALVFNVSLLSIAQVVNKPWQVSEEALRVTNSIKWVTNESKKYGPYNYNESKVQAYTLPNPLVFNDGSPVTEPEQWNTARREELMELFRVEMFGRRPQADYSIQFEMIKEQKNVFDGMATARDMKAVVSIDDKTWSFPFVVFIPNDTSKPLPAVINIKFWHVSIDESTKEPDTNYPIWPVKKMIERGYATAAYYYQTIEKDSQKGLKNGEKSVEGYEYGLRNFFAVGKPLEVDDWGSVSAWGWGSSIVLDYFETLDEIDQERVAVSGLSRLGTTALWAACEDQRFALVYSCSSGATGAKLTRRNFGQNIEVCIEEFPHFYCQSFFKYMNRGDELPFDQHELIGLIAPRAVYISSADLDLVADPRGEYTSLIESSSVFQLLGKESITNREMPPLNQPRVEGVTGYHIRPGGHTLTNQDWDYFLDFADIVLK